MTISSEKTTTSRASWIRVPPSSSGQRLDNYLFRVLKGVPRSHIYRVIRDGQVRVNSGRSRASHKLSASDRIRLPPLRIPIRGDVWIPPGLKNLRKRVLYEDDGLMVIDKPSGVVVHGGYRRRAGVIEALRAQEDSSPYLELVHRLDRETSGCLMLAKQPEDLRLLHQAFRKDSGAGIIRKTYLALLIGSWQGGARMVNHNLKTVRQLGRNRRSVVSSAGRAADSTFEPIRRFNRHVLVKIELGTGRMHQIRAHATAIGHPVAGDREYGDREANRELRDLDLRRLFLHAACLDIPHPRTKQELSVEAPLPSELAKLLTKLA